MNLGENYMGNKSIGEYIKCCRKNKKISQVELAKGICTQATISNIESETNLPSFYVLEKIAEKLEISLEAFYKQNSTKETEIVAHLVVVDRYCEQFKHAKAYEYLDENIKKSDIKSLSSSNKKRYYYFLGFTLLMEKDDLSGAKKSFIKVLRIPSKLVIEDVLSLMSLGILFMKSGDSATAQTFFYECLELIDNEISINDSNIRDVIKIYYNIAKFESMKENFQSAINICEKIIQIGIDFDTMFFLPAIIYELGFNLAQVGKIEAAIDNYKVSYYLAEIRSNEMLKNVIKSDLKSLGVNL